MNTKSIVGAPGAANSSQLLLRKPSVGHPRMAKRLHGHRNAPSPLGWLPAEYALKRPPAMAFIKPSAMIERAELPVQMNSTL